jgi:hypothetical protein
MSEHLPAEIKIGGKVRRSVAAALCEVIVGEGVALDWGEGRFRPQTVNELLAARNDDSDDVPLLRLCDDQASWGEFDDLERFLRDNDIAYIRHSDGKYDLDSEGAAFHPDTGLVQWLTDHNRNPVVRASELEPIAGTLARLLAAVRRGNAPAAKIERTLQRICDKFREDLLSEIPVLKSFEIIED